MIRRRHRAEDDWSKAADRVIRVVLAATVVALAVLAVGASGVRAVAAVDTRASMVWFRLLAQVTRFRGRRSGVPRPGDVTYVTSLLHPDAAESRSRAAVVGAELAVLRVLDNPAWALMRVEVRLVGGTLRLRGRVRSSPAAGTVRLLRVIGGSGRFAGAGGTVEERRTVFGTLDLFRLQLG